MSKPAIAKPKAKPPTNAQKADSKPDQKPDSKPEAKTGGPEARKPDPKLAKTGAEAKKVDVKATKIGLEANEKDPEPEKKPALKPSPTTAKKTAEPAQAKEPADTVKKQKLTKTISFIDDKVQEPGNFKDFDNAIGE